MTELFASLATKTKAFCSVYGVEAAAWLGARNDSAPKLDEGAMFGAPEHAVRPIISISAAAIRAGWQRALMSSVDRETSRFPAAFFVQRSVEQREAVDAHCSLSVHRTESSFSNRQRPLLQRLGFLVTRFVIVHGCQFV